MWKSVCCCFPSAAAAPVQAREPDEYFIIEVVACVDVPKMDLTSESDPYVKLRAYRDGQKIGVSATTAYRHDDKNPSFYSFHNLGFRASNLERLNIKVFDYDPESHDDLISETTVDVSLFGDEQPRTIPMLTPSSHHYAKYPNFSVILRRHFVQAPPPARKTIFLLRHGESKWNEAQAAKDLGGMLSNDHGLSATGIQQCLDLNRRWRAAAEAAAEQKHDADEQSFTAKFLRADFVFSSPLTRAIQTGIISLKGHPALSRGVTLMSCIRERKMTGGLDTVGVAKGDQIAARVLSETRAEDEPLAREAQAVKIWVGDCIQRWWSTTATTDLDSGMDLRVNEMLNRVHFSEHQLPIFVGHSIFFHYLYSKLLSENILRKKPDLAENMRLHRLSNASVLALDIEWSTTDDSPKIVDAALLFGGGFHGQAQADPAAKPAGAAAASGDDGGGAHQPAAAPKSEYKSLRPPRGAIVQVGNQKI